MVAKLFNLFALAALALFASTYSVTPVNAVSTGHHHLNRQAAHGHIAKRANSSKRANTQRCKQRPSSSLSSLVSISTSKAVEPTPSPQSKDVVLPSSSPAPAPKPSPKPAPPPSSDSSKKLCLAWANAPDGNLGNFVTNVTGYSYTWSPYMADPNHQYPQLQQMPMLWGQDQVTEFDQVVVAGYANLILGFNEPNEPGQSNLDPATAASLWKEHIEPKRALGYQLCSPATSSNPNGRTWMTNFLQACNGGCTFDFVCVHWYDVTAAGFKTWVQQWNTDYNLPVMVTEFAPQNFNGGAQPTTSDIWAFYQEVMPWIIETNWIKAACPFGVMLDLDGVNSGDALMASNGQPTALGAYIFGGSY